MGKRICVSMNPALCKIGKDAAKSSNQSFSALIAEALLEKLVQVKQ